MRDLSVNANKLAQFSCGIEGGEVQTYSDVVCANATTAEWVCGYPGGHSNQTGGTLFRHIVGETPFDTFGSVSLMSAENFLTSLGCNAEKVVDSSSGMV